MLNTVYYLLAIITSALGITGATITTIVLIGRSKAQHAIAAEWKELAQAKAIKISDLEVRVKLLEEQLRAVRTENDELRRLNLEYQGEVSNLRRRVVELEREVQAHRK